jgi:hypothetical protein
VSETRWLPQSPAGRATEWSDTPLQRGGGPGTAALRARTIDGPEQAPSNQDLRSVRLEKGHQKALGGPSTGEIPSAPGAVRSAESFSVLVDDVWTHRHELDLQPCHTMIYRLSGLEAPAESGLDPGRFFRDVHDLLSRLPPTVEAGHAAVGATRPELARALKSAAAGELEPMKEAKLRWGRIRLHRKTLDPEARHDRVFINTKPDAAIRWTQWLASRVLAKPAEFPGVDVVELTGPGATCRPDDVMVLVSSELGRDRLLEWIRSKAREHPETLESDPIPGAEGLVPGVSWGAEPDPVRYPGESFRSLRARVLFSAIRESLDAGEDRPAFESRLRGALEEAGIDPDAPHKAFPGAETSMLSPEPLAGAVPIEPGTYPVKVRGFERTVTVQLEIDEATARHLNKQKRIAFLPDAGMLVKTGEDRTRNPPATAVRFEFPLTYAADQRYKIQFGERPPELVAHDEATDSFYVPEKVRLKPGRPGRLFEVETEGVADAGKRPAEPMQHLVRRFLSNDPNVKKASAQRMEKLLGAGAPHIESVVPLEEGVNGKAIVKLSNGAVAMWKPSAAEYPDLMRANVDPDHHARREAFAYEVSKAMGHLGSVPPAVYRDLGGRPGALIALVRNSEAGIFSDRLEPLLADSEDPDYREIAILDHVLGSLDRHHGNVLFAEGRALAIDHGVCLPRSHGAQDFHHFLFEREFELDERERSALEGLIEARPRLEDAAEELGIDAEAVGLMFERARVMLDKGRIDSAWRTGT